MYETYYRLAADPFRLSPDPRFCYEHPSFARARKYMQYALRRAEGFIMVTGRPGTGKTTLVETLLAGLVNGGPVAARLVTAQLGPDELLRKVAYAFGLSAERLDKASLLHQLERFLSQHTRSGRGALLVVDEAQGLNASALEELRLLTNLQENSRPILQIFLVGQEQLRDIVQAPELEQFHQRLIAACHLRPLDPDETRAYVEHRLRRVGWRGDPRISSDAYLLIHRFSAGVPRRVNQVCSRLLLHGAAEDRHGLDGHDVLAVIEDLRAELLAPTDIPEGQELRDFLASLPPDPASTEGADTGSRPAGEAPRAPRAAPLATARLDPTPAPEGLPRGPDGPTAGVPETSTTSPAPAPPPARARETGPGLPPALAPTPSKTASPPRRSPATAPAPARPRRRLFRRVLPGLILASTAVALTAALAPACFETVSTQLRVRLAGLIDGLRDRAPSFGGAIARRPPADAPARLPDAPGAATPGRPEPVAAPSVSLARESPAPAERLSKMPHPEWLPPSDRPGDDLRPPAETLGPSTPPAQAGHSDNGSVPTLAGPPPPVGETSAPAPGADPLLAVRLVAVTASERPPAASPAASLATAGASVPAATPSTPARRSDIDAVEEDLAHLGLPLRRLANGTLHVNLRRLVPFEFNSAEVKSESRPFLDRLADVLRRLDGFVVQIVGHTDDSGPRDYNAQLSRRRAEAVTGYLRQQGVPGTRLRAEGRGASEPMTEVSDLDDAGPSDQRRIELFINRVPGTRA